MHPDNRTFVRLADAIRIFSMGSFYLKLRAAKVMKGVFLLTCAEAILISGVSISLLFNQ